MVHLLLLKKKKRIITKQTNIIQVCVNIIEDITLPQRTVGATTVSCSNFFSAMKNQQSLSRFLDLLKIFHFRNKITIKQRQNTFQLLQVNSPSNSNKLYLNAASSSLNIFRVFLRTICFHATLRLIQKSMDKS